MKTKLAPILFAGAVFVLAVQQFRLAQQMKALRLDLQATKEQQEQTAAGLETATEQIKNVRAAQGTVLPAGHALASPQGQARLAALERQVQLLSQSSLRTGTSLPTGPAVPEYDPTLPPAPEPAEVAPTNSTKRGWGPEQVIGTPDTPSAGDYTTAWASREPDGGPEWLAVGFDRAVAIAEVRVRETYNPGAIVKVVALVNNQEVVLWEGQSARGRAPRDFVVRPATETQSQLVTVYLDSAAVPGWNEIDAVELVGRDGSRQWAASASASSSYADRMFSGSGRVPLEFRMR